MHLCRMKISSKKAFRIHSKEQKKTGGGPPVEMSSVSQVVCGVILDQLEAPTNPHNSDAFETADKQSEKNVEPGPSSVEKPEAASNTTQTKQRDGTTRPTKRCAEDEILSMEKERHRLRMEILNIEKENAELKNGILKTLKKRVVENAVDALEVASRFL